MTDLNTVLDMLDDTLGLNGRARQFNEKTPLLGALPELDSMGVVNLIAAMEDRFGVSVGDDEISGDTFATVGSLQAFIAGQTG